MQKEVEQKMSELQMLSAANAFLKLRTSILETAVQTSEHTVRDVGLLAMSILIALYGELISIHAETYLYAPLRGRHICLQQLPCMQ